MLSSSALWFVAIVAGFFCASWLLEVMYHRISLKTGQRVMLRDGRCYVRRGDGMYSLRFSRLEPHPLCDLWPKMDDSSRTRTLAAGYAPYPAQLVGVDGTVYVNVRVGYKPTATYYAGDSHTALSLSAIWHNLPNAERHRLRALQLAPDVAAA